MRVICISLYLEDGIETRYFLLDGEDIKFTDGKVVVEDATINHVNASLFLAQQVSFKTWIYMTDSINLPEEIKNLLNI